MKFSYILDEIIQMLSPKKILGRTKLSVSRVSSLLEASAGDISFLGNTKYKAEAEKTKASVVLLPISFTGQPAENQSFLLFDNPSFALAVLCRDIERKCSPKLTPGVHESVIIGKNVIFGKNVSISPYVVIEAEAVIDDDAIIMSGCFIGHGVKIGKSSVLHPSVKVMSFCKIGERVILFAGVVIGADGFGYETINGIHEKVPQLGNVVIDDDVDIGANSTIDRARFGHTLIGKGTKIDNLVQIGHNVTIGIGCLIAAQTGISGSVTIGNYVIIGGQVGIAGHINIPDRIMIAGKSAISSCKHKPGEVLRGSPAMPINEANRFYVLRKRIPDLFKRVSVLEKLLKVDDQSAQSPTN